ncbi:ABC transporter permease subunit [Alkalicoccobacillus porphyridii]|uniref:ABC transporter permease subunit n=1 Tax=Alkalicoccobacillus porphyridii TaxID=2597270 RepID=A0A553ZTG8_9BACI|nr:ABC transporter permease subunit [Alkalicoccobacillus porphyridii]TSB44769.1 ABC transporter permease subunit [Alkalicoccobacillus porphyridii]
MNKTLQTQILPWVLPLLLLVTWQVIASVELVSSSLFPPPTTVLSSFWSLVTTGVLFTHMQISLYRAFLGLLIGGMIGLVLGILNGWSKVSFFTFDTSIQMVRNIPHLALLPLAIVWLGIGETSKIFLVALGVMFPIYINTLHGIRGIDPGYVEMGKMYGLRGWQLFRHIYLPGALPSIFVGFRYALGVMWLTLIVAETIATSDGLGYLAMNARQFMQTEVIIVTVIIYAFLGKLADVIAQAGEQKALRWHPNYRK